MKISGYRKNIMGTVSFDGKFATMRKAQEWIVYPMQDSGERITVQSDTRIGKIDLGTGKVAMSDPRKFGRIIADQLDEEERETLRRWVKSTGGVLVGNSVVKVNNTGAIAL